MEKLFVILALLTFSCSTEEEPDLQAKNRDLEALQGTKWQLSGFYNSSKVAIDLAEPEDCTECFLLEFRNSNLVGFSTANEFFADFSSTEDIDNDLQITNIFGTELIEQSEDGGRYMETLHYVQSYELSNNQLKLYYGDQGNFLLFNRTQ